MSDVRVRKLQEFIKQEVSQMLMRGMKDPRIGFTTVTDVEVTGDLRQAKIYVSLFGSDKEKADTLQALKEINPAIGEIEQLKSIRDRLQELKHARGHVRSELGKILNLRHVPEIDFDKDTSLDYSMHIESLINEIHQGPTSTEKETNDEQDK